jgi:hypothetical protein
LREITVPIHFFAEFLTPREKINGVKSACYWKLALYLLNDTTNSVVLGYGNIGHGTKYRP